MNISHAPPPPGKKSLVVVEEMHNFRSSKLELIEDHPRIPWGWMPSLSLLKMILITTCTMFLQLSGRVG